MKRAFIRFETAALIVTVFVVGAPMVMVAGEKAKDRSPNGQFAMSLQEGKDRDVEMSLIDTKTHKKLVDLDEIGHPWCDAARILWTPDSKRFAFYHEDRRGSATDVYIRKDSGFEKVELPDVPECEHGGSEVRDYFTFLTPKKWVKPDTLMLLAHDEWSGDDGKNHECNRDVTVIIDPSGKASIQSIQENKSKQLPEK